MFYLFLERDRQGMSRWGTEWEGHRIRSRLQALNCQHRAPHGARTHKPWDHDLSQSQMPNRLNHPGVPLMFSFVKPIQQTLYSSSDHLNNRSLQRIKPIVGSTDFYGGLFPSVLNNIIVGACIWLNLMWPNVDWGWLPSGKYLCLLLLGIILI